MVWPLPVWFGKFRAWVRGLWTNSNNFAFDVESQTDTFGGGRRGASLRRGLGWVLLGLLGLVGLLGWVLLGLIGQVGFDRLASLGKES